MNSAVNAVGGVPGVQGLIVNSYASGAVTAAASATATRTNFGGLVG